MKVKAGLLISILVLLTGVFGAAAQDTFFGKTADEIFPIPEVAETELEQQLAFEALLAANIPDGHALGEGKTITFRRTGAGLARLASLAPSTSGATPLKRRPARNWKSSRFPTISWARPSPPTS